MVANFEKETGIKVNYQTFENNEALHAKLVAGNTGYDIVVPGAVFAKPQIDGGLLARLDKSKIPNYGNLDPAIMQKLGTIDPGNDYLVPWAWRFTTVGINRESMPKAQIQTRVEEMLNLVQMAALAKRKSRTSSRAGSSSAWRWRAAWPGSRNCCCSTNRWARWTASCASAPSSSWSTSSRRSA